MSNQALKMGFIMVISLCFLMCREKPSNNSITWDSRGFKINGHYALFPTGGIQYYRIPPGEWEDRLRKLKAAGITLAEVYISWEFHEPEEGKFDFTSPDHDLDRFLRLCEEVGIYVYIRPGPYITNETDGGGLPGWLLKAVSSQPSKAKDGLVSVRQVDADYLAYSARYLEKVDVIIRRHQFTTNPNGCVLFYALENEYDWFWLFKKLEGEAVPDVPGMFRSLRDIVWSHGITIPLTDASGIPPGNPFFAGTGDIEGILITPNQYPGTAAISGEGPYNMEGVTAKAMAELHSSTMHNGLYVNTPSLVSETDRLVTLLQRIIFGGMEGANLFNFVGYTAEGYQNGIDALFSGNVVDAINNPAIAYFGSQIDFRCPVSPRGVLRPYYFIMKRKIEFLNTFSEAIASCGEAKKDGVVSVNNTDIGTWEDGKRSNYWLETDDGTVFLSLLNQGHYDGNVLTTPTDQGIGIKGIKVKDISFPNFTTMTIPFEDIVTSNGDEKWNDMIIPVNLPLGDGFPHLSYSTSEILTLRNFNGRKLLVIYGREGTPGETRMTGLNGNAEVVFNSLFFPNIVENDGSTLTFHYVHAPDTFLVLNLPGGKILQIIVTTIERANKYWFFDWGGRQFMVSDIDYLESAFSDQGNLKISAQRRLGPSNVLILSPFEPAALIDDTIPGSVGFSYTAEAMALAYSSTVSFTLPTLASVNSGRLFSEPIPAPSQAESSWTGEPKPLEEIGIYRGHAWYMTGFSSASPVTSAALHVDSGSDIVSVYLNNTYIGTVLPTGKAVDLTLPGSLVIQGENSLVFRVQIWGHSIYHVPKISGTFDIPTIVLDSKRGLFGKAWVKLGANTVNLAEWKALSKLQGERDGFPSADYDTSGWQVIAQPITPGTSLVLGDGQTLWYHAQFSSSSLPNPARIFAPVLIKLIGKNCMATIWFNNHLIGRWLSDNDWLLKGVDTAVKGTAKKAVRNMWIRQEPDSLDKFYLPLSYTEEGQNTVTIAFEDASNSDYQVPPDQGIVNSVEIVYNTDHLDGSQGALLKSAITITPP